MSTRQEGPHSWAASWNLCSWAPLHVHRADEIDPPKTPRQCPSGICCPSAAVVFCVHSSPSQSPILFVSPVLSVKKLTQTIPPTSIHLPPASIRCMCSLRRYSWVSIYLIMSHKFAMSPSMYNICRYMTCMMTLIFMLAVFNYNVRIVCQLQIVCLKHSRIGHGNNVNVQLQKSECAVSYVTTRGH